MIRDRLIATVEIGSHRRRIDMCQFRWPWVTFDLDFMITTLHTLSLSLSLSLSLTHSLTWLSGCVVRVRVNPNCNPIVDSTQGPRTLLQLNSTKLTSWVELSQVGRCEHGFSQCTCLDATTFKILCPCVDWPSVCSVCLSVCLTVCLLYVLCVCVYVCLCVCLCVCVCLCRWQSSEQCWYNTSL